MPERWKDVVGFEAAYEVSEHGAVRSKTRVLNDGRQWRGRWLKTRAQKGGYLGVTLSLDGTTRSALVHRLVLEAFVGPCPPGMEGCHKDDRPENNHLANLRWDTRSANAADQIANGNHAQSRKTQCPGGHALRSPNLVPAHARRGWRQCLACNRENALARRQGREFSPLLADANYDHILKGA